MWLLWCYRYALLAALALLPCLVNPSHLGNGRYMHNSGHEFLYNPASAPIISQWSSPIFPGIKLTHKESLSFFNGKTLTVLDAGLALNTHGSPVNGFFPLRAFVAGLFFNFMFNMPPSLKLPVFFNSVEAISNMDSITDFTSPCFRPVFSAMSLPMGKTIRTHGDNNREWSKSPHSIFLDYGNGVLAIHLSEILLPRSTQLNGIRWFLFQCAKHLYWSICACTTFCIITLYKQELIPVCNQKQGLNVRTANESSRRCVCSWRLVHHKL